MALDDFWKKKATDTSKEQERIAKEQERKDFELISKTEKILFEKYKNIQKFDRAINKIKLWIVLNSFWRSLYLKILNDLNNKNPKLISLKDAENQILQSLKSFKKTNISSSLDIRNAEIRRIKIHVIAVIWGILLKDNTARVHANILEDIRGGISNISEKINNLREDFHERREARATTRTTKRIEKTIKKYDNIYNYDISWLKEFFSNEDITLLNKCLSDFSNNPEAKKAFIEAVAQQRSQSGTVDIRVIFEGITKIDNISDVKQDIKEEAETVTDNIDKHVKIKLRKRHGRPVFRREDKHSKDEWTTNTDPNHLDERDVNLREYLTSWSMSDTEIWSEWLTLKQVFLIQNRSWLRSLTELTEEGLENKYNEWDNNRLNRIKQVLNRDDLLEYATRKQVEFADFDLTTTQNFREWIKRHPNFKNKDNKESQSIRKFLSFTQWELIWELVMNVDMNTKEWLELLQILSLSTAKWRRLFDDDHLTWDWNAETQYFLENALKDPTFQNSDTTWEYSRKILEILNSYPHLDTSYLDQDFQTLSEVQDREQNLIKNPDSIWQSQSLEWPREFVWITDSWYQNSNKLEEQSFLNSHMQEFNGRLTEFLKIPQLKEWNPIDETAKIKMEQIWKTIPLEQINAIYNLFASKPEEQEKFNNFLKENNLPNIDINDVSLKRSVLEQDYSFNPIAKYCYERIWFSCQNEIISESWKTLQYLSDKTWDTALNIKNKVLEFFLPWISIRPEKAENGIFYFRDENNLDTLYSFNPENWEISQQGNISLEDEGIISFRSWWSKGNLLQKIQWFQNIVDIDLLDILPDKNPGNMEELENQILNKIQSKIAVEKVADTSVVNKELLRLKNERNVCYNGIVWDLKQLLNIEDDYLYETSWENYKIFFNLLKTFERINIEYPNDNKPFISMKLLLDKICDSTGSFTLLKPSLLEKNWDSTEEISQENTGWEVQNSQETARGFRIIKNLINPNTQLFDVNLIDDLANNSEIDQYLAERKFDRVIGWIQKNKELKIAKENYEKEIAKLYSDTHDELHWLNEDVELFANINSLENEGNFLS